jgi:hypothetical protein
MGHNHLISEARFVIHSPIAYSTFHFLGQGLLVSLLTHVIEKGILLIRKFKAENQ